MAITNKIGTSHFICKAPRVSEGNASRASLKARSHPLHETLGRYQTWKKEIQLDIPFLKVILLIMARPIRIVYEGAVYHITIRGNERRPIFKNDEDRSYFITKLAESVQRYDVRLYLFTLMLNHTQLVLETQRGNLSRFMQRLQTAYTMYFNRRYHQRSSDAGSLWSHDCR